MLMDGALCAGGRKMVKASCARLLKRALPKLGEGLAQISELRLKALNQGQKISAAHLAVREGYLDDVAGVFHGHSVVHGRIDML